jgi:hypothetical protein
MFKLIIEVQKSAEEIRELELIKARLNDSRNWKGSSTEFVISAREYEYFRGFLNSADVRAIEKED